MKSEEEKKYTSTKTKLLHNPQIMKRIIDYKAQGLRPNSIQIAPTDKCNLHCVFCSVKNREGNELPRKECFKAILDLMELGAKTVEITGGGDPTLYLYLNELIAFCLHLGLKVGLITNGIKLKEVVHPELLKKLTWIRVSLNGIDEWIYPDIPTLPESVTLGFSYVWNEKSTDKSIQDIKSYQDRHKPKYIRVVPDCRNVKFIEEYRKTIAPKLKGWAGSFFQEKDYHPPNRCWMGYLKPFVNSDGYVYHCSANPLIDLKFNPKFRMGSIEDIKNIWQNPKPFNTKNCGECFFKEHNELIEELMKEVDHYDFI